MARQNVITEIFHPGCTKVDKRPQAGMPDKQIFRFQTLQRCTQGFS